MIHTSLHPFNPTSLPFNFKRFNVQIFFQIIFLVFLGACQKDLPFEESEEEEHFGQAILRDGSSIGLDQLVVADWYANHKSIVPFDLQQFNLLSLDPAWLYGYSESIDEVPVYLVPVVNDLDSLFPDSRYNFIFYESDTGLVCRLLVFSDLNNLPGSGFNFETFEGISFQICEDNSVGSYHIFKNERFKHIDLDSIYADSTGLGFQGGQSLSDLRQDIPCGNKNQFWRKLGQSWEEFWMTFDIKWDDWAGGGDDWWWVDEGEISGGAPGGFYFLNPWGSGGSFGYTGSNPNQSGRSYSHLFNNQIFNKGYKELKNCREILVDDPAEGLPGDAQSSLGILLANGSLSLNQFHLFFTASVDMYLDELSAGANPSLTDIINDNMNNFNYIIFGVNHNYQYLIPDIGLPASKYVYDKVSANYIYCNNLEGSEEVVSIQGSYEQQICNCMEQFSVEDALQDYLNHYLNSHYWSQSAENDINYIESYTDIYELTVLDIQKIYFGLIRPGQNGFSEYALSQFVNIVHEDLIEKYGPQYLTPGVNINDFLSLYTKDQFLATAAIFDYYMIEVGVPPDDPYMWQLMMEVFYEELGPVLLELIPGGIGDLIGAYNEFNTGNYWMGSLSIVLALVPGDEIYKVWKKADNIRDGWKSVSKIVYLWNKLFNLPGGQKVLNKLPQEWKNLPGSKLTNGDGLKWVMPNNGPHFRLMDANPNSQWPSQQVPYSRFWKNGNYLDINGNPISPNDPNFNELTHIPISILTNSFLDNFF